MSCRGCEGYARRIAELEEELRESQDDRNFVKTLWRQVQNESSDVGSIVNTVLDRVAKQTQEKDRSVLLMLQAKDSQITAMKNEVGWLESTLGLEKEEKAAMLRGWDQKESDLNELVSQLEEQIALQNLQLTDPTKQKREEIVEKLGENKSELEKQLISMHGDLTTCASQISSLKRKQGEQAVETEQLQHLLSARDVEVESHKIVICELKESISHKKGDISQLRQKLELADSQAEGALKALEKSERKVRSAQAAALEQERAREREEEEHRDSLVQLSSTITGLEERVTSLVHQEQAAREECEAMRAGDCDECNKLQEELLSTQRAIEEAARNTRRAVEEADNTRGLLEQIKERCSTYLSRPLATHDLINVLDIILGDVHGSSADLERASSLVKQLQLNCREKEVAILRIQEIHDRRLERMTSLQGHLSEALDELKILDKSKWKELCSDYRDINHTPEPLRHEDSSTVWADLKHYKTVCTKLKRELHKAEEKCETFSLQRTLDINTFNEMKTAVLVEQQDCERKLRVANHQSVCGCNLQLEILREKIEELLEAREQLNSENIKLLSALQTEQGKVGQLEKCVCDMQDNTTQTLVPTATASTVTENIEQVHRKENVNFTNTLTLLDKLTMNQPVELPQSAPKTPVKPKKRAVCTRTSATQTLTNPPVKVLQKPPPAVKIRMASLNQQVAVLTKAKHKHAKELSEEEAKARRLEGQIATTMKQLSSSQSLVSALNEDVRAAQEETQSLRDQMTELEGSGLRQSELATLTERQAAIRKLTHQNNLLSSQLNNHNQTVQGLQKELEEKGMIVLRLEEKTQRCDKMMRQQRTDNEQIRQEFGSAKQRISNLQEKLEDANKRCRKVQDVAENRKGYIETLKTQLTSSKVGLEKVRGNYEECKKTLEMKCREMKNLVRKQESQEHRIGDIKGIVASKLAEQEKQFAAAERGLHKKLTVLNKRNIEWEKCIRQAIGNIVKMIKQEQDKRAVTSSLSSGEYDRAKSLSSSILQLSEADFLDIMSSTRVNNTNSSQGSMMEVWKGQLSKILSLDDFGAVLANSLVQLFEEYARILSGDVSTERSCSIETGNSLTHSSLRGSISSESDFLTPTKLAC